MSSTSPQAALAPAKKSLTGRAGRNAVILFAAGLAGWALGEHQPQWAMPSGFTAMLGAMAAALGLFTYDSLKLLDRSGHVVLSVLVLLLGAVAGYSVAFVFWHLGVPHGKMSQGDAMTVSCLGGLLLATLARWHAGGTAQALTKAATQPFSRNPQSGARPAPLRFRLQKPPTTPSPAKNRA